MIPITARVALAPGAAPARTRGTLVVMWLTADERDAFEAGAVTVGLLRALVTRAEIVGEVDAAHAPTVTVHVPPGRIALHAVIDVDHTGIEALLGGGDGTLAGRSPLFDASDGTLAGRSPLFDAGAAPVTLTVRGRPPSAPRPHDDRWIVEHLDAPEVAGTLDNPTSRRFSVRLPVEYADPARRFPVIYALPGLHSTDAAVASYRLDPPGAIVVAVDTRTTTGSAYLVDSATGGAWDTFFTHRLIPYVDAHYRTLAHRGARALVGHSTGGFNAVSFGLRHPDRIGAIGASSPDALDLSAWLLADGAVRPWIRALARVERGLGGVGQLRSYAASWSPTGDGFPFDDTGILVEPVWQRWLAHSPRAWLRSPARVAAIAPLANHIYLTVGERDEFDLQPPTVAFSQALTAAGIAHELVVSPGDHASTAAHMAAITAFLATRLDHA